MFRLPSDLEAHLSRGGTLLVPTRQRAHAVQLAYAAAHLARGARVWSSPRVLTPSAWARSECERRAERSPGDWPRLLTSCEEWLLWRRGAAELAREYPFLDVGALAESLQRAGTRAADFAVTLTAGAPDSEAQLLYRARQRVVARCDELRAATVSALIPKLENHSGSTPPWLRGFDVPPPWLRALAQPAPRAEAEAPRAATTRAVRTSDTSAQAEAIAAWCCERLRARPDARLLVILPGAAGVRERLAALIRGALDAGAALEGRLVQCAPVGIEGGEPLSSLVLPAQALTALGFLSGATLDVQTVSDWLGGVCWKAPGAAARAALALMLRERGVADIGLRELLGALQLAPPELKPAARELDGLLRQGATLLGEAGASPKRWSERFEAALAAVGWPGEAPVDSASHQTRLRWRELLEEFGGLASTLETLSLDAALELLRSLAQRTPYRPADEDVAVTVTPMLADPVVIYDGIWVGSLSADVLPQPVTPDPFLPLLSQIEAGVPEASIGGRRQQARSLLAAWSAGSEELVLSVPAREGDLELLPSPYLKDIASANETLQSLWLPQRLQRNGCTETLEDPSGTSFNPRVPLPSGTRALTLQNSCAFRAYAELRLGALDLVRGEPGVPMDQRGLLLHAALQMLWDRLRDSETLNALADDALEALITECVTQAARTLQGELRGRRRRPRRTPEGQFDLFAVLSPSLERECRRARTLIRRLCELERTRAPFAVQATEHVTELTLGGGRVRMRLDRIDAVAGGRAVLDYKSGRPGSPDWYGERPTHPQLLAYLTALGRDVVALATVNVTAREVRFTGVASAAGLLPRVKGLPSGIDAPDWSAQQASWEALIERLIRAFLEGDARVDPAPGACDYCHLTDLCRIGAHLSPELPAHPDDSDE